jgi:16S rRNA (cytidine1402-2'-O)-methyltransferase
MSKLYLIPTPIGNLEDITLRARRLLGEVDEILAEDTRKTGILLKHLGISKPLRSHHKFNEHKTLQGIIERILSGKTVGMVSDAGTPGISDPGFLLVRACIQHGIEVEALPGPTAFIPALICSGIPCDRFLFEGFLPQKKGRQSRIRELSAEKHTLVFYESPYRLVKTLEQLAEHFGSERQCAVSREISKLHEEHVRGSLTEVAAHFSSKQPKGEIVLIVEGNSMQNRSIH